jgi:hypothetical protein
MTEEKTTLELAREKADQLTEEYKSKGVFRVHPIVFKTDDGEDVVGFVKEPSRAAKMAVMDKAMISPMQAVEEILEHVLIKEHSDPRMSSDSQEFDDIHMGLAMSVFNLITFKVNAAKKK